MILIKKKKITRREVACVLLAQREAGARGVRGRLSAGRGLVPAPPAPRAPARPLRIGRRAGGGAARAGGARERRGPADGRRALPLPRRFAAAAHAAGGPTCLGGKPSELPWPGSRGRRAPWWPCFSSRNRLGHRSFRLGPRHALGRPAAAAPVGPAARTPTPVPHPPALPALPPSSEASLASPGQTRGARRLVLGPVPRVDARRDQSRCIY